jgi:hypothetical protein
LIELPKIMACLRLVEGNANQLDIGSFLRLDDRP